MGTGGPGRPAHEKDATPAQISLAWMLHKKDFIVPIPPPVKLTSLNQRGGQEGKRPGTPDSAVPGPASTRGCGGTARPVVVVLAWSGL